MANPEPLRGQQPRLRHKQPGRPGQVRAEWSGRFLPIACLAVALAGCSSATSPGAGGADAGPSADGDFAREAALLYNLATCSAESPVPAQVDRQVRARHCAEFQPRLLEFKHQYVDAMKPFIAEHRPDNLPETVVYPFGGGDLLTALTTYPEASTIYTMSLEHAGDIRKIARLDSRQAGTGLKLLRSATEDLLILRNRATDTINTNFSMKSTQRGALPGQITLFLVALAIHGQEPVSLRYFAIDEPGSIRYLSADDIVALERNQARPLAGDWSTPNFSAAFSHCELRFKPRGEAGPIRVHRHIAANLDNAHFGSETPLFRHLMQQGRVAAMTKGALYLLWEDDFAHLRDYLLERVDFMISDSTGLSPLHALPAGFGYLTCGRFEGIYEDPNLENVHNRALLELYQGQPDRSMPYRYGYVDRKSNPHLLFLSRNSE